MWVEFLKYVFFTLLYGSHMSLMKYNTFSFSVLSIRPKYSVRSFVFLDFMMSVSEWVSPLSSEHWYFPVITSPLNSSIHRTLGGLFLGCFRKITSLWTEFIDTLRFLEIALMDRDSFRSFIIVSFSLLLIVCFLGTSSVSVLNLFPQCLQLYLVVFIFSIGCFAYKCNFFT